MMKNEPINQPITFKWKDQECVIVNNNMANVVLCMIVGSTSGVFSVHRSDIDCVDVPMLTIMQQMEKKYKVKKQ